MAKVIIGRVMEKEILTNALNSSRSELIAIYGRRRISQINYEEFVMKK